MSDRRWSAWSCKYSVRALEWSVSDQKSPLSDSKWSISDQTESVSGQKWSVSDERLIAFVQKNSLLSNCQCGIWENRQQLLQFQNLLFKLITDAIENKKYSLCLLIDLRKAFDTVDHKRLLAQLYMYGVRGIHITGLKLIQTKD